MNRFIQFTLILTTIFSFAVISNAQEQDKISDEKRRLIAELIVLTKTDQQIVEITDTMLATLEKNYPIIVEQTLARNNDLSVSEKKDLSESMSEGFLSFSKKFRERLPKEIDYPKYVRDVVYPLYDKYFTEKELKDLIAFYRTDTGQKVITTMPQLFADSEKMSQIHLFPQVLKLVDEIFKEQMENPKGSPPPKPRNR